MAHIRGRRLLTFLSQMGRLYLTDCIQTILLYLTCKSLAVTHLPLQKLPF